MSAEQNRGGVTVTCMCGTTVEHEQWCLAVPKLIPYEQRRRAWNLIEDFVAGLEVESKMDVWRAIALLRRGESGDSREQLAGTKHMDDCRESYRVVVYGDGDEVLYDRIFLSTNELFYAGLPGIARRVMGLVKQVSGVLKLRLWGWRLLKP